MMVARVKADSREVRSEPPTYVSINPREDTFSRTVSAQSLPVNDRLEELSQMTMYDRTLHMLAVDPIYQKEVALGKRIGFYRLGKELGAGNFSKVKLGIHVLTKEKVAIKIMDRTKMDTKAQRLLEREIKSMEQMHHPNIIRLFECVETLTRTHLVLEYAGGGELYADQSYNGAKVDIWALGVLLHFMLVGVTPFRGESVPELKTAILHGSFTLPMYLEHSSRMLIEGMLSMEPYKRPKIDDIKKSIWLRGCRFPATYLNLTSHQEKMEAEKNEIARKVWEIMHSYGITEQMLEEAQERGPKNAMIGTYRIVQYQVQTAAKQMHSESSLAVPTTPADRKLASRQLKTKSKTCTII
ncbi:hypothetical protein ANCCEY_03972 [Ancylostoma ceylanicum]|uniref:non-specific serine/threonine protein kinase n=1 Tax=Ancylostoma ceylanicum TaxID=53326 RepID=A0A0D6M3L2_9BILA|nr:hypothetical protein ANCCEY_03972 [Ancylostoma ceylanicum]